MDLLIIHVSIFSVIFVFALALFFLLVRKRQQAAFSDEERGLLSSTSVALYSEETLNSQLESVQDTPSVRPQEQQEPIPEEFKTEDAVQIESIQESPQSTISQNLLTAENEAIFESSNLKPKTSLTRIKSTLDFSMLNSETNQDISEISSQKPQDFLSSPPKQFPQLMPLKNFVESPSVLEHIEQEPKIEGASSPEPKEQSSNIAPTGSEHPVEYKISSLEDLFDEDKIKAIKSAFKKQKSYQNNIIGPSGKRISNQKLNELNSDTKQGEDDEDDRNPDLNTEADEISKNANKDYSDYVVPGHKLSEMVSPKFSSKKSKPKKKQSFGKQPQTHNALADILCPSFPKCRKGPSCLYSHKPVASNLKVAGSRRPRKSISKR